MKQRSPGWRIIAIASLGLTIVIGISSVHAETVLAWREGTSVKVHILSVYQRNNQVEVTAYAEPRTYSVTPNIELIYQATVEMNIPSIVEIQIAEFVADSPLDQTRVLYENGAVVADYDPNLGDGWAYAPSLGFVNVSAYPWVYDLSLGWLYCVEAPVVNASDRGTSSIPRLSFWLWQASTQEWLYRENPE